MHTTMEPALPHTVLSFTPPSQTNALASMHSTRVRYASRASSGRTHAPAHTVALSRMRASVGERYCEDLCASARLLVRLHPAEPNGREILPHRLVPAGRRADDIMPKGHVKAYRRAR